MVVTERLDAEELGRAWDRSRGEDVVDGEVDESRSFIFEIPFNERMWAVATGQ